MILDEKGRMATGASLTVQMPLEQLEKLYFMAEHENRQASEMAVSLMLSAVDIMFDEYKKDGVIQ